MELIDLTLKMCYNNIKYKMEIDNNWTRMQLFQDDNRLGRERIKRTTAET